MLAEPAMAQSSLPASEAARVRLAAHPRTSPATLRLLADDPAVMVRAAVAVNPSFAQAVHVHLAADSDERVRALLARKLACLLPSLSSRERTEALAHAHDVLLTLAQDAAIRVRSTLSEILHAMPDAPRAVIMRLAQDEQVSISEPVLRLSPMLTDADLLELLASPPHADTAQAVAARTGLSSAVSDVIAGAADNAAIQTLLRNGSAMILEGTLDALVGRAGDHPDWHEPLTQRPILPERTARALSRIVAGTVLEALSRRLDLAPDLAEEIGARLVPVDVVDDATLMETMRQRHHAAPFDDAALLAASGELRPMLAVLAVAAGVPLSTVDHAVVLRSTKGLVSLAWRAGFSMEAAVAMQTRLGLFSLGGGLSPAPDGGFPLSVGEMDWQLELLNEAG